MKNLVKILGVFVISFHCLQAQEIDSVPIYKKKVLETIEVDFLTSYYKQDGTHSAVSGGNGSEDLTNYTPTFIIAIPLNEDDVLTLETGISAYTSASSSNIDPFDGGNPDPFQSSSGASESDALKFVSGNFSRSSDDRNTIWNTHLAISAEYDYFSIGFGGGIARLFNNKNSEFTVGTNIYLDTWKPIYPKELEEFKNQGINSPLFDVFQITGNENYNPSKFNFVNKKNRNSYAISFGFSQVITKKFQASVFLDLLYQQGLLSTPYQRVHFADVEDSFVNTFHLGDDIERLPDTRFKIPVGARFNYYLNEKFVLRSYYRFYTDDWNVESHTFNFEIPYKITDRFTIFPMYRYYTQTKSEYFAPYNSHLSTEKYYTSDYDLSSFEAHQYGVGVNYTDIFMGSHIWKFGIKNIDLRYNHYDRSDGLSSDIVTLAMKFVLE